MEQKAFNTKEFWSDAISLLSRKDSHKARSLEFMSDTLNAPPPGGLNPSDGFGGNPYEQNNDLGGMNGMGIDPNMPPMDPMGGGMPPPGMDPMGMPPPGMDPMSGGMPPPPMPTKPYKPTKNPFQRENGKIKLAQLLSDLYIAVEESLEEIQMSGEVDNSVVVELEHLSDSILKIKKSLYLQPVESTLFKYKLCVKTYELIAQSLQKRLSN